MGQFLVSVPDGHTLMPSPSCSSSCVYSASFAVVLLEQGFEFSRENEKKYVKFHIYVKISHVSREKEGGQIRTFRRAET